MNINILNTIQSNLGEYSAANKQIAGLVLSQPEEITRMSIAALAQQANVSEPTIMRFCRSLGFSGFTDFKFSLVEELALRSNYIHTNTDGLDSDSYILQVTHSSISALQKMENTLNEADITNTVRLLSQAKQILFWGFGTSTVVAMDAYEKFFRWGISCSVCSDPHLMSMQAAITAPGDVVFIVSHTGVSRDLLQNARIAQQAGATVVALTRNGSPLDKICDRSVNVDLEEDTGFLLPMISRLGHLLIIDVLVVGVMLYI